MKIRNKQTGEIREISEKDLDQYGLGGKLNKLGVKNSLWNNIRANKGSGKKPTKAMLEQERKIRAAEKAYGGYMADGGINNPGFRALPDYVQEKIKANMNYGGYMASGGCMECGGMMEIGGKLPKELLKARLEAQDYLDNYAMGGMLDQAGDGKWIQKATASIKKRGTEGVCTGSKFGGPSCPPGSKRYNLAKTFRKMAKSRKDDGGYVEGQQYEMSDVEIARLRAMGYKIKEV